jgi:hypothetical protein
MEARYSEHAKATAICVQLALAGLEEDIQKELQASGAPAADALRRVLELVKARQECVSDLATGVVSVPQMIKLLAV